MENQAMSVLDEFIRSFKFYKDSRRGKFSLDTYLDVIGQYTDKMILQCENEAMEFTGGTCTVKNNVTNATYDFTVKMYFQNADGESIVKEATRCLSKNKFTTETEQEVLDSKSFEINRPE